MRRAEWLRWLPHAAAAGLIAAGAWLLAADPEPPSARTAAPMPAGGPPAAPRAPVPAPAEAPPPTGRPFVVVPGEPETPAAPAPTPAAPPTVPDGLSLRGTVVLDVGRPSDPPETEPAVLAAVAANLQQTLEKRGFRIVRTRQAGEAADVARRAGVANAARAALWLRLFCWKTGGWAVFYPDRAEAAGPSPELLAAGSVAAEAVAAQLQSTLAGRHAGRGAAPERLALADAGWLAKGSALASLPVIAVSIGDPTNHADAGFLGGTAEQAMLVDGLAAGVEQYLQAAATLRAN